MSIESAQLLVSLCGILIAAVGIPLLYFQIRDLRHSLRIATHSATYDQAATFRSHLVKYPELRKYLFDGVAIQPEHPDFDRVVTIAEIFLNYLEYIAVLKDNFGKENDPALESFIRAALAGSPIMRERLSTHPQLYSDKLRSFMLKARRSES